MLNRRFLRLKVMQALYAFFQGSFTDMKSGENYLLLSLERIYEIYLLHFLLIKDTFEYAHQKFIIKNSSYQNHLVNNKIYQLIIQKKDFNKLVVEKKLSYSAPSDNFLVEIFKILKESKEFEEYQKIKSPALADDQKFTVQVLKKVLGKSVLFYQCLEERYINWSSDNGFIIAQVIKTILPSDTEHNNEIKLLPLSKNWNENKNFAINLFRSSIINNDEYHKLISETAENWEVDRIALIDIILMKMTLCEFLTFEFIPVKVSLNEYIEISKIYSTVNSKVFINGILDKLLIKLQTEGKIKKTGKGTINTD